MLVLFWFSTGAPPSCFLGTFCRGSFSHGTQAPFSFLAASTCTFACSFALSRRSSLPSLVSRVRLEDPVTSWEIPDPSASPLLTPSGWRALAFLNFSSSNLSPIGLSTFPTQKNTSSPNTVSEKWRGFPPVLRDGVHKKIPPKWNCTAFRMTSLVLHPPPPLPPPCGRHRDKPRGSPAPHGAQALRVLWRRREDLGAAHLALRVAVFRIFPL